VSLRRAGERRGSILGELPARRLPAELRTAVLVGFVDQHAAELRAGSSGDLCPACVRRSIATRSGLCEPCHLSRLAAGHREEIAVAAGRREVDAARALKYRARKQTR
jgi:hypothetical protein